MPLFINGEIEALAKARAERDFIFNSGIIRDSWESLSKAMKDNFKAMQR